MLTDRDVLTEMVRLIDSAGLLNLSNGVQLGATSWYVKMSDCVDSARAVLAEQERAIPKSSAVDCHHEIGKHADGSSIITNDRKAIEQAGAAEQPLKDGERWVKMRAPVKAGGFRLEEDALEQVRAAALKAGKQ
jgi:hypothetical protein